MPFAARAKIAAILLGVAPFLLIAYPVQLVLVAVKARGSHLLPMLFWRLVLRLMGVRVTVRGAPAAARPLLIAANHVSWLDIPVLGSLFPLSFVAKSEVGIWPVIGHLSRLQHTIYIDRSRKTATAAANEAMAARLAAGDALVLFPEGTSSDGAHVLPFRSSLLGAVRAAIGRPEAGAGVAVQPAAIVYRGRHGLPMNRRERPTYAWYGDMELAPHLGPALADGVIEIDIVFGEPAILDDAHDRKAVARDLEAAVRRMLAAGLAGRG